MAAVYNMYIIERWVYTYTMNNLCSATFVICYLINVFRKLEKWWKTHFI